MSNFELIDDYLANRLEGKEKEAFENQLGQDPALKTEFELQKQIVEGIRQARATELKSMLSKVPVSGGGAQVEFTVLRIAAGVVLAGVVSAAVYYYMKSEDLPPIENAAADVTKKEQPKQEQKEPEQLAPTNDDKQNKAASPEKQGAKKEDSAEEVKPAVRPSIELADPAADLSEENKPTSDGPKDGTRPDISPSQVQVETDSSHKKYDFHYQFAGNKLMLYGSFDRSLYEVLEINGGNHSLFLFYKDNFYLLDESQQKVTRLSAIQDQSLLKKLREYRSR